MTRIDTKTSRTQSSTSSEGAQRTKQAESAPTLDELDQGMSLAAEDSLSLQSDGESFRAEVHGTPDAAATSFAEMTPLEQSPVMQDIGALESQCGLEVQGHAYDLRSLAGEVGGADGQCLEKASDALVTSVEKAGEAQPGSALPVLAEGVYEARGHVEGVADEGVREQGEGFLSRALSSIKRGGEAIADTLRGLRPEPAPGETHELGFQGGVGLGALGAEAKDVISIGRERNADGSGGDYVVAREISLGLSAGFKPKLGAEGELGGVKGKAKLEVDASAKEESTVKLEYRSKTLAEAHERLDDVVTDKAIGAALNAVPGVGPLASIAAEGIMAYADIEHASSVTYTRGAALEAAAELGIGKGQLGVKGSASMKLDLEGGKPTGGELALTTEIEGGVGTSFAKKLGDPKGDHGDFGFKDLKGVSVKGSFTTKAQFEIGADGKAKVTGGEVSASFEFQGGAGSVKATVTLASGKDADAVRELLAQGDEAGALDRLLDANASLTLEGSVRGEIAIGGKIAVGAEVGLRGHYAAQATYPLGRFEGRVGDLLGQEVPKQVRRLLDGDLHQQLAENQMVR